MSDKIFINYRRDDSNGMAGRLHDRLARTFGYAKLFMDVDHIPVGIDFVAHLNNQVAVCDVMLVVIGSGWLDARDESDRRRLDDPDDFVAIEIAAALARDIRVIPVLVDGVRMPKASELPESLKPLARRHAVTVRHAHFGHDAEALVEQLRDALGYDAAGWRQWRVRASVAVATLALLLLIGWVGYAVLRQSPTKLDLTAQQRGATAKTEQQPAAPVKAEQQPVVANAAPNRTAEETGPQQLAPAGTDGKRRVALVVGNSNYQSVPGVPNASRDANAVAKMFRDAGFNSVDVQLDVGVSQLRQAIRKFQSEADKSDIAVVYYAGHGAAVDGINYLIPVDAKLVMKGDADDEGIPLDRLILATSGAKELRLVILDAARNIPSIDAISTVQASKATASGFGKVEPALTDILIAYAAKSGTLAEEGNAEHSPYTTALLKNLCIPGLDIRLAFGRIRDEVLKSTSNRQQPFIYGGLKDATIPLVPSATMDDVKDEDARADFGLVQQIGTAAAWKVFLGSHPTGYYADLARAALARLDQAPNTPPTDAKDKR